MPIEHYDIEKDELYLEGYEVGILIGRKEAIEKGRKEGAADALRNFTIRMLQMGEFSKKEIALNLDVAVTYVNEIEKTLLDSSKGLQ